MLDYVLIIYHQYSQLLLQIKAGLISARDKLKMGDPRDFSVFLGAVIDRAAFKRITGYIEHAKKSSDLEIIGGGGYDDS